MRRQRRELTAEYKDEAVKVVIDTARPVAGVAPRCQSLAYKPMTGKRDTQLGINKGSPAFMLDDPDGNAWVMKSVSLILDATQTHEGMKDLGTPAEPARGLVVPGRDPWDRTWS